MERQRTRIEDRTAPDRMAPPPPYAPPAVPPAVRPPTAPLAPARSARTLLVAWVAYWLVLVATQLWPIAVRWWQVRGQEHGAFAFTLSGDFSTAAAWIAIPPLLMTLVWLLWTRGKRP